MAESNLLNVPGVSAENSYHLGWTAQWLLGEELITGDEQ
jgi:hypothetical protein